MKIDILCVGKIKEKFFRDAIDEYRKRLSRYASINIIVVEDEKTPDNASEAVEADILRKEGERLLRHVAGYDMKSRARSRRDSFLITLEIEGKLLTSVQLSRTIDDIKNRGVSHLQFVIGGSLGLSEEVTKLSDMHLSFSKMTFPHQLMRVVLLEQIYRSFRISSGEPYHK